MQVILSAIIQGFSTVQVILSALIQDFSTVHVFFISAIPRFSSVQELSGFFGHQRYIEVSSVSVQVSIVRGPGVLVL